MFLRQLADGAGLIRVADQLGHIVFHGVADFVQSRRAHANDLSFVAGGAHDARF